ncbi:MAG: DUF4270 domain-containing protein [Flavobacteriales bacterium]|nr:DUF4270 domain-containing protein [Flavobacteriales bacterium]
MTYRLNKLLILSVLFVIGLLACRKDSNIGVSVLDDENRLVNQYADTFSLITYSEFANPVVTFDTTFSQRMLGSYLDPKFGLTSSDLFLRLFLETEFPDFSNVSAVHIDSAVLSFSFRGKFGTSNQLVLNVHELNEEIQNFNYESDDDIQYNPTPIGGGVISVPSSTDSVLVGSTKEPAQVRLKLDNSFALNLLQRASGQENGAFISDFKGIAVIPDSTKNQDYGTGAVVSLDMLSNFSKLTVYYQKDGLQQEYAFRPAVLSYYFNKFYQNYDNSTVLATLNDTTMGQDWFYIQSLAGLNGRIKAPHLKDLIVNDQIVVQRAELNLQIDISDITDYPANTAFILRENSTGEWINLKDLYIEGSGHYGGLLEGSTYSFNITRYVQDLFTSWQSEESANFDLQVIPDGEGKWDARRAVVAGFNNGAKLKIQYTTIK